MLSRSSSIQVAISSDWVRAASWPEAAVLIPSAEDHYAVTSIWEG
jgi:hypothetical protein